MRAFKLLKLASVFCLASVASAQQPAGPPAAASTSVPVTSDPQAVALIQRSLAILTGGTPVSDVTLIGTARRIAGSEDETGTATLKATALGDSRVDFVLPSGNRGEIRNHSAVPLLDVLPKGLPPTIALAVQTTQPAGAWFGPDGVLHGIMGHNLMTDASWFLPALTLTNLTSSQGCVLYYFGQQTLNGQAVLHVSASQQIAAGGSGVVGPDGTPFAPAIQHLSQTDFYFDPATLLPIALAFSAHPDSNALVDIPVEIQFSNYQAVNGIEVPFRVEKFLNNALVLDLRFSNVTLNSGLAASQFQLQ